MRTGVRVSRLVRELAHFPDCPIDAWQAVCPVPSVVEGPSYFTNSQLVLPHAHAQHHYASNILTFTELYEEYLSIFRGKPEDHILSFVGWLSRNRKHIDLIKIGDSSLVNFLAIIQGSRF